MKVLDQYISAHASIYHADTCEGITEIPSASIDFSVFSPPFEGLFTYSASDRDLGNTHGGEEFSKHLQFIANEQFRTMKPGRIVALHCMDLPTTITHHGYVGFIDFPARLREVYERAGFIYHCPKVTIWKDPEVQANRTYARQLTYGEMIKDSAMSGIGTPDYILLMRKPGKNEVPIAHRSVCAGVGRPIDLTKIMADNIVAEVVDHDAGVTHDVSMIPADGSFCYNCEVCGTKLGIFGKTVQEHFRRDDILAKLNDAGKPEHWQRVASPVWSMPLNDIESMTRKLYIAISRGLADEASGWAQQLAAMFPVAHPTTGELPPFPSFVWATANGLWLDGFVDYEGPRAGNPDRRGIDQGDTLNFRAARENEDERHICPLQKGVVDRLFDLYTNPGDVVLTPFMGIGTEVVQAILKGRKGVGFELKGSYFRQAVAHVKAVEPGAVGQQLTFDAPKVAKCSVCGERDRMSMGDGMRCATCFESAQIAAFEASKLGKCQTCESEGTIGSPCEVCGSEVL